MFVVKGNGWYVTFRSQAKADAYCIHIRRKYGELVWVERLTKS